MEGARDKKFVGSRLFVALPLPEQVRTDLIQLERNFPGLRFSGNLHLTLRFIGNVENAAPYARALRKARGKKFELKIAGIAFLRGDILHAALGKSEELYDLKRKVDLALTETGLEPKEREFHPHITLKRLKKQADPGLCSMARTVKPQISWQASEFCLYRSILRPGGAIHQVIEEYRLD